MIKKQVNISFEEKLYESLSVMAYENRTNITEVCRKVIAEYIKEHGPQLGPSCGLEHDFEQGDLVQLKCGGPVMVVHTIGDCSVTCKWFGDTGMNTEVLFVKTIKRADT